MAQNSGGLALLGLRSDRDIDQGVDFEGLQTADDDRVVQAQQVYAGLAPVQAALTHDETLDLRVERQGDAQDEYEPGNEV
jgi:hypothetical protein